MSEQTPARWGETVLWHGMPLDPDQHPERPWWRSVRLLGEVRGWRRTDGITLGRSRPENERVRLRHAHRGPPPPYGGPWTYRVTRGPPWERESSDEWRTVLAAHDVDHPLPVPPPFPTQVWLVGSHKLTVGAVHGLRWSWSDKIPLFPEGWGKEWPPSPTALLLSGPFAPWEPPGP